MSVAIAASAASRSPARSAIDDGVVERDADPMVLADVVPATGEGRHQIGADPEPEALDDRQHEGVAGGAVDREVKRLVVTEEGAGIARLEAGQHVGVVALDRLQLIPADARRGHAGGLALDHHAEILELPKPGSREHGHTHGPVRPHLQPLLGDQRVDRLPHRHRAGPQRLGDAAYRHGLARHEAAGHQRRLQLLAGTLPKGSVLDRLELGCQGHERRIRCSFLPARQHNPRAKALSHNDLFVSMFDQTSPMKDETP